ncbi:MAG: SGNH/GDSL hydrolase family protein [Myxococcaceae bacterium]
MFRYIAVGDSTGVGVGASSGGGYPERIYQALKVDGVPIGILNLAQSGAVSSDLVTGQLPRASTRKPHLVTVGIGSNDVWRLVPEATFAQNVTAIADALAATGAHVVVCNLIDLALTPAAAAAEAWVGLSRAAITERIRQLNRHFDALAARRRFAVVDLFGFSQREVPSHPEYFCPDGFHPSSAGYERWADLCMPAIKEAVRAQLEASSAPDR